MILLGGKYCTILHNDLREGDALAPLFFNFALEYGIRKGQENQMGLKLNGAPLFFNFALEYGIRKGQENQMGLKLNGTHGLLANPDDFNLLKYNMDNMKKNTTDYVTSCRICGENTGFLQVHGFSPPSTPQTAPHSSSSVAGTVGQ
jgi:hypothetical protein